MQDAFEVFKQRTDDPKKFDTSKTERDFFVGLYYKNLKDKRVVSLGVLPFKNNDESWPPPTYMYNPVTREYSIYYKGEIKNASREDCLGMENTYVWNLDQLIDRINGDTKWIDILK